MKDYQIEEWSQMVKKAEHHLTSGCPLIEDEVIVAVAKQMQEMTEFIRFIATDYIELSHDKVRWQRDDYVKRAKKLLERK